MASASICGDDMTMSQWKALSSEIEELATTVLSILKDADPVEARRRIEVAVLSSGMQQTEGDGCSGAMADTVIDSFLEQGYARVKEAEGTANGDATGESAAGVSGNKRKKRKVVLEGAAATPPPATFGGNYSSLAERLLFNEFRRAPVVQLRRALAAHHGRYSDAYIAVSKEAMRMAGLKKKRAAAAAANTTTAEAVATGSTAAAAAAGAQAQSQGGHAEPAGTHSDERAIGKAAIDTRPHEALPRNVHVDVSRIGRGAGSTSGSQEGTAIADGGSDHIPAWAAPSGLQELAHGRPRRCIDVSSCPALKFDLCCVRQWHEELGVHQLVVALEEEEREQEGHVDCGCCYGDYPIQLMVQCQQAHLFCRDCVKRFVEEVLFGTTRAERGLPCRSTDGCEALIPESQLQAALPPGLLEKFERKCVADSVQRAQLPGLTNCHACEYAAELPEGSSILDCPNCNKQTCKGCGEEAHIPLRCDEVEKKDQASVRHSIEELMTRKMVRECSACKTKIVKEEGCNKITCRCGAWTCYVCRSGIPKNVGYAHFCQHVLDPGQTSCRECQRCLLWQDNRRAEEAELARLQKESVEAAAGRDPGLARRPIGPDLARLRPEDGPRGRRQVAVDVDNSGDDSGRVDLLKPRKSGWISRQTSFRDGTRCHRSPSLCHRVVQLSRANNKHILLHKMLPFGMYFRTRLAINNLVSTLSPRKLC
eukprot:jgi/Mesvir1/8811/Mv02712-RA.1